MRNNKETMSNKVWSCYGQDHFLSNPSIQIEKLDKGVYELNNSPMGFYLTKVQNEFIFDYKIYGLETKLVDRTLKTFKNTGFGNLGVLLNGLKGTGKTVTSKIICNTLNLPIIVVGKHFENSHLFINSIPQDIVVFIDEYEKIFGNSSEMLTIMDGALNSEHRRVFILTTNELNVDSNLLQRPSRIRYLKKFEDLSPAIVEEIVNDVLIHKQFTSQCIKFISNLEVITVDIVKAVIQEVNLHEEEPEIFKDVFNVKKLTGKYNLEVEIDGEFISLIKDAELNRRPRYTDRSLNDYLTVNGQYLGVINRILNWNTIELLPIPIPEKDDDEDDDDEDDNNIFVLSGPTVFKIVDADVFHYNYNYDPEGFGMSNKKDRKIDFTKFKGLMKNNLEMNDQHK